MENDFKIPDRRVMMLRTMRNVIICLIIGAISLGVQQANSANIQNGKNAIKHSEKHIDAPINNESISIPNPDTKGTKSISLGSASADGNSPGYIVFRSYYDAPKWYDAGHMIDHRHNARIHMINMGQPVAGDDELIAARWPHYNMFDASEAPNGVFINGPNGVPIVNNPFTLTGREPQLDVDESGWAIPVYHSYIPVAAGYPANQRTVDVVWDIGWITFVSDTVPQSMSQDPSGSVAYPFIEYQESGGTYVTHVLATEFSPVKATTYWRRVGGNGTFGGWTTPLQLPQSGGNNAKICASRVSQRVSIVYLGELNPAEAGSMPFMINSYDMGVSWNAIAEIVDFDYNTDGWTGWIDIETAYDTDDYLHIVWNTLQYDATTGEQVNSVNPTRILHWSDRVAGPHAGGTLSTIDHIELDYNSLCGRGWTNETNVARPVMSVCNDRLYVFWQQFGDPEIGDSTDCVDETVMGFAGSYNSEIMMSVSMTLDGSLWDSRRNITNSHSPGCDGTTGNECDSDQYPSVSRYGMDVASMGTTYWSAVPEVFEARDMLDAGWPEDGHYIDMMYINDAFPGNTRWTPTASKVWTNNPIKWVRIPCVPPDVEPELYMAQGPISHPNYWVKSGYEQYLSLDIENFGNTDLNIYNIYTSELQGLGGWLGLSTSNLVVSPGMFETIDIILNSGGAINPAPGSAVAIEGYVIFESDDPNNPAESLYINTIVTDTVAQYTYHIVRTGLGMPMGPTNIGTAGNYPHTGGYMQFYEEGGLDLDCDSQNVYLYDLTPVVMTNSSTGWWAPNYDTSNPDSNAFIPVTGGVQTDFCDDGTIEQFLTGEFVTADSSIGMTKAWIGPSLPIEVVLEQWKIFSRDGTTHYNVQLGEYLDIDVPSDTGVNNFGGVEVAMDYVWLSGQETDFDVSCAQNDERFYATGLLGYYYTSEYDANPSVNHTGLAGAYVNIHPTLMNLNEEFEPDSLWEYMTNPSFNVDNSSWDDQRAFLAYGGFDIKPNDTLVIWTFHSSYMFTTQAGINDIVEMYQTWYMDNRSDIGFCDPFYICGDVNGDFIFNLADVTKLIDYLFVSHIPLPIPEAADIDGCNGIDIADLMLMMDKINYNRDVCNETYDCAPSMPDDVIHLNIKHRPDLGGGDSLLQLDLYGRYTVPLRAATCKFSWDNSKLTFDSSTTSVEAETIFTQHLELSGLSFTGFSYAPVAGQINNEYVLWGSYYFTVDNWQAGDSVVIDLNPTDDISKLRFATTKEDGREFVGYTPRWDGPLVVRDAGDYGDMDGSGGSPNINDVVTLVDYLMTGESLTVPPDLGNVDGCDGTDIADVYQLIDQIFLGASLITEAPCDEFVAGDFVSVDYTTTPGDTAGSGKMVATQALEMELTVLNIEDVLGATMGFRWSAINTILGVSHLHLQLDSAKGTSLTLSGFDAGIVFYEDNNIATSNLNSRFQFAGSANALSPGVSGDATQRLWAKYYFTVTGSVEGDVIIIDTSEFSDGTTFKLSSGGSGGHGPTWYPPVVFDCCGTYTSGMTGNANCSSDGYRDLSDIQRLIDYLYITKAPLCCLPDGNTNGDVEGLVDLADIVRLIDHVFISKGETEPCQ